MENRIARVARQGFALIAVASCAKSSATTPDAAPSEKAAVATSAAASGAAAPSVPTPSDPSASSTAKAVIPSGKRFEEATHGPAFNISLRMGVTYCDNHNMHALKIWDNSGSSADGFCGPARERNASCAGVTGIARVRAGVEEDVL